MAGRVASVVIAVLAVPAWALAQTPVSVPPSLQALEQRMAQIRFNTARISYRFALGELGPAGGGAELGAGIKGPKGAVVFSTVGALRLSPPEASTTSKVEEFGLAPGERAPGTTTFKERTIGNAIYTYRPSIESYDGGRPWVRSKQTSAPKSNGESAALGGLSDTLVPSLSGDDARGASAAPPFAKLIDDVNGALSLQEVGPSTVDGQQVTEFTASLTMATLLPGKQLETFTKALSSLGELGEILSSAKETPKQREEARKRREEDAKKVRELPVELELFIAPSGLPVRTITVIGDRDEAIGSEEDILALDIPVVIHAPPARGTIGEAQLRKLEKKRVRQVCSLISVRHASNAEPVICPRAS
jgi:hypothetical protein